MYRLTKPGAGRGRTHSGRAALPVALASALASLIPPSPLHLADAQYITNNGEIVGTGNLPNGDQHVFLLIPNN